jgi:hypothetical protein
MFAIIFIKTLEKFYFLPSRKVTKHITSTYTPVLHVKAKRSFGSPSGSHPHLGLPKRAASSALAMWCHSHIHANSQN